MACGIMETDMTKRKNISEGMFRPLRKQRFSDQIAELIQKKILEDNLEIGTNLPSEKDMAAEFGVSRSVVREALRILEMSGLVDIRKGPTGGIFVTNVYHEPIKRSLSNMITSGEITIEHLFEARMLIEPRIAREAAQHARRKDLTKLRDLLKDSEAHHDDPVRLKQNNLRFHLLLARASGNPVLSIMLESVIELLVERILDFEDLSLERHFLEIHQAIFQVIVEKNPDEAEKLIKADIQNVNQKISDFKKSH
jgi:GntR family transcriptional repressor for pyruvate dehydrogenase complex